MTERELLLLMLESQRMLARALLWCGQGPSANALLSKLEQQLGDVLERETKK
jgi:hypothetical protein